MKQGRIAAIALTGLAALAAAAVQAQVYKYKDASGRTVYSNVPPPGVPVEDTGIQAPPPANGADKSRSVAEQEQAFKKRRQEAADKEKKAAEEAAQAQEREKACEEARNQLAALESGQRMSRAAPDGSRIVLDDEMRAQETAAMTKRVQETCK